MTETIEWIDNQTAVFVKDKDYHACYSMQLSLYDDSIKSKFVLKPSVKVMEAMTQHFLLYLLLATNASTIPDSIIHNRVEIFQSLVEMPNYN